MRKILYVFGGEKASGAEIVIDRLMRNNKEVEPHLLVSPGAFATKLMQEQPYVIVTSDYLKKLNRNGVSKWRFLSKAIINYLFISFKVLSYIRKNKIDVVHANTIVPASYLIPALIISKALFPKVLWLWSDHDISYFSKKDNIFANLNLRFYTATLVVSKAVKNKYLQTSNFNKVHVLYNGLDTAQFKPDEVSRNAFRTKFSINEREIVFGIAGILSLRKGQLTLMEAIITAARIHKNIRLLIAGNEIEEELAYAAQVKELIAANKEVVVYIGSFSNMPAFYNGCDVIVSNSNKNGSEPLGTTIYEAMACEKVVISSNTGGSPEIVNDLNNGLLFEVENYDQLSTLINYCIDNIKDLTKLRDNARITVVEKFNIKNMVADYNQLLDAVAIEKQNR